MGLCSEGICSGEGVKVSLSHLPEPVSQLLVNFILLDGGPSGPWVKVSCWASSGSPPITYSLVGRDSGTFVLAVSTVAVLSTVAVISGRLSRARHLR